MSFPRLNSAGSISYCLGVTCVQRKWSITTCHWNNAATEPDCSLETAGSRPVSLWSSGPGRSSLSKAFHFQTSYIYTMHWIILLKKTFHFQSVPNELSWWKVPCSFSSSGLEWKNILHLLGSMWRLGWLHTISAACSLFSCLFPCFFFCDFCFWKSFHRESLKIHRGKKTENTTNKETEENRTRLKRERNPVSEKQAGDW